MSLIFRSHASWEKNGPNVCWVSVWVSIMITSWFCLGGPWISRSPRPCSDHIEIDVFEYKMCGWIYQHQDNEVKGMVGEEGSISAVLMAYTWFLCRVLHTATEGTNHLDTAMFSQKIISISLSMTWSHGCYKSWKPGWIISINGTPDFHECSKLFWNNLEFVFVSITPGSLTLSSTLKLDFSIRSSVLDIFIFNQHFCFCLY